MKVSHFHSLAPLCCPCMCPSAIRDYRENGTRSGPGHETSSFQPLVHKPDGAFPPGKEFTPRLILLSGQGHFLHSGLGFLLSRPLTWTSGGWYCHLIFRNYINGRRQRGWDGWTRREPLFVHGSPLSGRGSPEYAIGSRVRDSINCVSSLSRESPGSVNSVSQSDGG